MYTELQASYHLTYIFKQQFSAPKPIIITYRNETPIHRHEEKDPASFKCILKKVGLFVFMIVY